MKPPRTLRLATLLAAAVVLGFLAARVVRAPAEPPPLLRATLLPEPVPLPALALIDQDGQPLGREAFAGRWTLVFFGFMACPDVCPTTLATLAQAHRLLREVPEVDRPRVLFISVDPERDDPARLRDYVRAFAPDFLAAGGTPQGVARAAGAFGLGYARIALPDGGYTVEHGSSLFVVGPTGGIVATSAAPHDAATLAQDYRLIVQHARPRS